ncbi:hypothetical protein MGN70_002625 [Eutypa lata]|nr:hypothetical protein MGN70_002625 [Eutypa lata]
MSVDEFIEAGRIPETTLRCIHYLRRSVPKASISVEVEKPGREGLEELTAEADVVFYSRSWAESKGYQSARQCLEAEAQSGVARRASHLLCTWGEEGGSCLSLASRAAVTCPATAPGQAIQVVE